MNRSSVVLINTGRGTAIPVHALIATGKIVAVNVNELSRYTKSCGLPLSNHCLRFGQEGLHKVPWHVAQRRATITVAGNGLMTSVRLSLSVLAYLFGCRRMRRNNGELSESGSPYIEGGRLIPPVVAVLERRCLLW